MNVRESLLKRKHRDERMIDPSSNCSKPIDFEKAKKANKCLLKYLS